MNRISTADARDQFPELVQRVAVDNERVILTDNGRELVALVPAEDAHFLQKLEDRFDIEEALVILAEVEREGTVPWEEVKARLGL